MLQRNSIFDLSTLEAMRAGKCMILSETGGNPEFNIADNIVLVKDDNWEYACNQIIKRDTKEWETLNRRVFKENFSNKCFLERYAAMIDIQLLEGGGVFRIESTSNKKIILPWKNRYKGMTAVICGSGSSLDGYKPAANAIHISLNRALFYELVHFDIAFMQDMPKNQPYSLEDYNRYDCVKFYGIITNPNRKVEGLGDISTTYDELNREVYRYELSPNTFDHRVEEPEEDIGNYCFSDMQSVLFSALQFAVYAGFSRIEMYGIDFSAFNFNGVQNPNKYVDIVTENLLCFKRYIKNDYRQIELMFGKTNNLELLVRFNAIEEEYQC